MRAERYEPIKKRSIMKFISDPFFTIFDFILFIAWIGIAFYSEKYINSGGHNFILFLFVGGLMIQANRHRIIVGKLTERINTLEEKKKDS
jgi:hypothetical protein